MSGTIASWCGGGHLSGTIVSWSGGGLMSEDHTREVGILSVGMLLGLTGALGS